MRIYGEGATACGLRGGYVRRVIVSLVTARVEYARRGRLAIVNALHCYTLFGPFATLATHPTPKNQGAEATATKR